MQKVIDAQAVFMGRVRRERFGAGVQQVARRERIEVFQVGLSVERRWLIALHATRAHPHWRYRVLS